MQYFMFTKQGCPYCSLMKASLTKKGVPFTVIDLSNDDSRRDFYERTGKTTVPQLYWTALENGSPDLTGECLGGWAEVKPVLDTLIRRTFDGYV